MSTVALLGLGEVGRILATDLLAAGHTVTAWDTAFDQAGSPATRNRRDLGLPPTDGAAAAVAGAHLVISAVTPGRCVDAARAGAPHLLPRSWFVDLNSASPEHKVEAAGEVEARGAHYVEAALMAAIGSRRLASPFLLGGPHAAGFAAEAGQWGLTGVTVGSATVGRAAAAKLCRSVVVKGLEALFAESLLAARHYGVQREVLDSLPTVLPEADWERLAGYFLARSAQHGVRRAEEMDEAAAAVTDAGVEPLMARATARRQARAGRFPQELTGLVPTTLEPTP